MPSLINDGVPFRYDQASSLGLCDHALRRALESHRIRRLFAGVYVDEAVPDSRVLRAHAVKLVTPRHAVVSHCFAAWFYNVDTFPPGERHSLVPTLLIPHGRSRVRLPGVKCRQAILDSDDIEEHDGTLITNPLRTTSDLLRTQWRPYALAAADGMTRAGLVERSEIARYVEDLRGYRGVPQARELAGVIDPGAESPGESWHRLRILDAGFPRPTTQVHVVDEAGNDRYFDLGYRELLIASEFDGREFHTLDKDRKYDDNRRSYFERRFGWRFANARREDIFGTDPAFEARLGELLGIEPRARFW